ncbi:hypothetical protein Trydic_g19902, partial [Trypoxylus dichotomus]
HSDGNGRPKAVDQCRKTLLRHRHQEEHGQNRDEDAQNPRRNHRNPANQLSRQSPEIPPETFPGSHGGTPARGNSPDTLL